MNKKKVKKFNLWAHVVIDIDTESKIGKSSLNSSLVNFTPVPLEKVGRCLFSLQL